MYIYTTLLRDMAVYNRNFIIFSKYRRLQRLWQFFFTGWVLVLVTTLVAASIFTRQLLWTPISAINLDDIVENQFKMTNAKFAGTDKDGNPFNLSVSSGNMKYGNQNEILMNKISGTIVQKQDDKNVTNHVRANNGKYNISEKTITLIGDVRIDSDTGDKIRTNEMVIRL